MAVEAETTKDEGTTSSSFWQVQLELSDREHKDWIDDGRKVYDRYKSERKASGKKITGRRFNILFSNTEVMRASLYGKAAKPDVRRKFADQDRVARQAADIIERGLIYCGETYDVDKPIEAGILDYLLPGRAVIRIEYEPIIKSRPVIDPMMGAPLLDEEGQPVTEDFIADQKLREKYVFWEDYRESPARNWDGVWWVAFRHTMSQDELDDNFPETAIDIPLNWQPEIGKGRDIPDDLKKAEVWEIWDKKKRQRLWVVKGMPKVARVDEDPYGLESFFPLPEPPSAYMTTDTRIPTPEFHAYSDQADDLDEIIARISRLTRALKRRGIYDQSVPELKRLAGAGDNEFVPVANYQQFATKGGLAAAFQTEDIAIIATVLVQLYSQKDMLVKAIYEVMGIADIMRGDSSASETLGAQQLKAQFGSTRLKRRQQVIQKWIRDIYKIKAEIIAEHFEPDVLSEMTGIQATPEIMELLRTDKLRSYRIDIETDSTIFEDAAEQQKARTDIVGAVTQFLQVMGPVVQAEPAMMPLAMEMLSFAVRGFKEGRQLEDAIDQTKQALEQAAKQKMMQPPQPDPQQQQIQMEMQHSQEIHEMDKQEKILDFQVHQQKTQGDIQAAVIKHQLAAARPQGPAQ